MGRASSRSGCGDLRPRRQRAPCPSHLREAQLGTSGGASEPGESLEETALRELKEETGIEAVAEHLTGIYYDQSSMRTTPCFAAGSKVERIARRGQRRSTPAHTAIQARSLGRSVTSRCAASRTQPRAAECSCDRDPA